MDLFPVIMCGGGGTRLWPASTENRPKQFIPLIGERSLFQDTALRVSGLSGVKQLVIVAGLRHAPVIEAQLAEVGLSAILILEPEARDSGPAIAAAAAWIETQNPQGVAVVVASDHHLPDPASFHRATAEAAAVARQGRIVTFGVVPRFPSTAYGYIKPGAPRASGFDIEAFVEKPDAARAREHVAAGYLWNSGNFVATAETLMAAFGALAADIAQTARDAVAGGRRSEGRLALGGGFRKARKISFDYAVMEQTDRASVLPVDFEWSDLGAWSAVRDVMLDHAEDNTIAGDVLTVDTRACLIRTDGPPVAAVGVRDLAIVVENGAVLVCDMASDQSVKAAHAHFRSAARTSKLHVAGPGPALDASLDALDRWLRTAALPLWWSLGADHQGGGFHETLDLAGTPGRCRRRVRVQARQAYAYARAGELGWPGPWRAALDQGLAALDRWYRRPDGLYRFAVEPDGAPADESAALYEQAFVLLAWAQAARVVEDPAPLIALAEALRSSLDGFRWRNRGFRETGPDPFQANCHMHLLEACMLWLEVPGAQTAAWRGLAEEIVELALDRFIAPDTGILRESFDADWRALSAAEGGAVEPGHQFEWAWLLHRWRALGGGVSQDVIRALYLSGRNGVDPVSDLAMNRLAEDGTVLDAGGRLWCQTEHLRCAAALWDETGEEGYVRDALAAADVARRFLDTPVPGLWRDRSLASGVFVDEPAPASSLYHLVALLRPQAA